MFTKGDCNSAVSFFIFAILLCFPRFYRNNCMRLVRVLSCMTLIIVLFGCTKQSQTLPLSSVNDYCPLQPGKSFIYRLDSTLYLSFGTVIKVNSYIAKDSITNTFQDNAGRTSYIVHRYLTDTLQQQPFVYSSDYYITPANNSIEVVDANNLRYIKLAAPITAGNRWQGNSFISTSADTLSYLSGWQYEYQNINMPYAVLAGSIDSTITILGVNVPPTVQPFDPNYYQSNLYSAEVYAKGIGLIYKEFTYWVWQPLGSITPGYTADSYGIKLNLISYH